MIILQRLYSLLVLWLTNEEVIFQFADNNWTPDKMLQ